ncbi:MAG: galactokinase [Rikenellaceae bacterium]|jgi:galactokinase|nr:galactokinase [Rikenellaceae bacterium]
MNKQIENLFDRHFGGFGRLYASPGRVNLIGEHTDYNLGFVLPGAIDKAIYMAIRPGAGSLCRIYSADYDEAVEFDLHAIQNPEQQWARYIFGVVQEMQKRGAVLGGFDAVFGGDVPLGAGLSSSAALESVAAFALNDLFEAGFDRRALAEIGQMTEHHYVGVRCGIMDQFASLFGEREKVIQLDCRSLEYRLVPFRPVGYRVLLLDTQVKHSLASSEYNVRREQCEEGVAVVARHESGVVSLRDVTLEMLSAYKQDMSEVVYRRCHFVVSENQRVLDACDALERGDYADFGQQMFASHRGLSGEYEVSCPELDFLAEKAREFDGVLGARMMGGGFGGCTINVIEASAHDAFVREASDSYQKRFGIAPRVIDVVISDGARRLK